MNDEKRTYSLCLAGYLKSKGFKDYKLGFDEEKSMTYFVFPKSTELLKTIGDYNKNLEIKLFGKFYKDVKDEALIYKNKTY
ncbi:hypothetical protein EEL31_23780 [Brevibacillus laterosporus]|nr:DUF5659 domain-containing protein [Brevibacillus laterosporus]TPG71152.1 hypothetical protein EEL31_23780 [Brevibacillus laterosporus]